MSLLPALFVLLLFITAPIAALLLFLLLLFLIAPVARLLTSRFVARLQRIVAGVAAAAIAAARIRAGAGGKIARANRTDFGAGARNGTAHFRYHLFAPCLLDAPGLGVSPANRVAPHRALEALRKLSYLPGHRTRCSAHVPRTAWQQ